eukprot:gene5652-8982_t
MTPHAGHPALLFEATDTPAVPVPMPLAHAPNPRFSANKHERDFFSYSSLILLPDPELFPVDLVLAAVATLRALSALLERSFESSRKLEPLTAESIDRCKDNELGQPMLLRFR